ncbi:MAG: hypothetical protein QXQ87_07565, partial [Halobacteria archaeon]
MADERGEWCECGRQAAESQKGLVHARPSRPAARLRNPCFHIRVDGRSLLALFDPGARYSYVRRSALPPGTTVHTLREPGETRLGGRVHSIREEAHLRGDMEKIEFTWEACVINEIGPAEEVGRPLDLLVGALALEKWRVCIDFSKDPPVLDLSGARKREFCEYWRHACATPDHCAVAPGAMG